jgi:hypothetical protein
MVNIHLEVRENREIMINGCKVQLMKGIPFGAVLHRVVTTVNSSDKYT